jgi:hypothetical protein
MKAIFRIFLIFWNLMELGLGGQRKIILKHVGVKIVLKKYVVMMLKKKG